MLNFKELAENILADLMNNGTISDVLLKTKIFASKRGDKELLDWVTNELNGFEDVMPPKYRVLKSGLRVQVFVPFRGIESLDFPIDIIENDKVRNLLANWIFYNPISEIDNLYKNSDKGGTISTKVPVYAYKFISDFIRGEIQDANKYTTAAAVSQIIVSVKSVLIDFLLKVSNEEDINFNNFIKTNPQMITINNSGIMNTGSGEVNAEGATIVNGDNNTISADDKKELLNILAEIDKIVITRPNTDYDEVSKDIRAELQKEKPEKKFLKRCFQAIPSFLVGVASSATGNGLTALISSALALL